MLPELVTVCCAKCTHTPETPCRRFVECITEGPLCHDDAACREKRAHSVQAVRRDTVAATVVYVGAGTCGLGAGAAKTLAALRAHAATLKTPIEIIETGCIGLCTAEPLVDIHVPGRARLSFANIKQDAAAALLDQVLAGTVPASVLGQYRPAGKDTAWNNVGFLDQHPFFRAPDPLGSSQLRRD